MTEKHEESGTEEETGNSEKRRRREHWPTRECSGRNLNSRKKRGFSQYYPMRPRLFIFLRTSLTVKKLLSRVIENKERTEEDRALPGKLTERVDYIASLLYFKIMTFRLEYEHDYKYEDEILSTRTSKFFGLQG